MTDSDLRFHLRDQILKKRPILRQIFNEQQSTSVKDYSLSLHSPKTFALETKKQEFISGLAQIASRLFSPLVVNSLTNQLNKSYLVSTAEHHGPMTHPFFVHSNLLAASDNLENIIVLAVGNVSLNNSSYPRGLMLHSANGQDIHLPFFSDAHRMSPVFKHKGYTRQDISRLLHIIDQKSSLGLISQSTKQDLKTIISRMYVNVADLEYYSDQITLTNNELWNYLFRYSSTKPSRLLTFQLEDVVIKLLNDYHLYSPTHINQLLFNESVHQKLLEESDGIPGNFNLSEQKGTFLFWALPAGSKYRQQLWLNNGSLVSKEGYKINLEPQAVANALAGGELIPNMFLSMVLLSEYYGLKCLGGFSQGTYLTQMTSVYQKIFLKTPNTNNSHTTGLRSDLVLAYFRDNKGNLCGASGLDLVLHYNPDSWEIFNNITKQVTLEEAMAPLFPELYKILYPDQLRQAELASLNHKQMIKLYDLESKVSPCITIS